MTRDGELVEPDGVPLITALRDEPHPVLCATADTGLLLGYERFDDGPLFGTTRVRVRRFSIVAPITEADMRDAETPDDVSDAAADIVDEATVPPRRLGCGCRTTSNRRTRVSWLTLIAASIALRRRKTKTHG